MPFFELSNTHTSTAAALTSRPVLFDISVGMSMEPVTSLPFDSGPEFKSWSRLHEIREDDQTVVAVVLCAPDEIETATPYAFLYRKDGTGDLVQIRAMDTFPLSILVAHTWLSTDTLEGLYELDVAALTAMASLQAMGEDESPSV